jgi:homoserine kinase
MHGAIDAVAACVLVGTDDSACLQYACSVLQASSLIQAGLDCVYSVSTAHTRHVVPSAVHHTTLAVCLLHQTAAVSALHSTMCQASPA